MAGVTGFGGAFLRATDPKALSAWYEQHLGMKQEYGSFTFPAEKQRGPIAFAFFGRDNSYFPLDHAAMVNLQVDDLDALLDKLAAAGVAVDPKRQSESYGKFGWFTDPEGNRVELWQPK